MSTARMIPPATMDELNAEVAKDLIVVYATLGEENSSPWQTAKVFLLANRAIELFLVDSTDLDPAPKNVLEAIGWTGPVKPIGSSTFDPEDVGGVFLNRTGEVAYTLTQKGAKLPSWLRKGLKQARKAGTGGAQ